MNVREFQKLASDIVREIDEKLGLSRDAHLSISQLLEELGEIKKKSPKKERVGRRVRRRLSTAISFSRYVRC